MMSTGAQLPASPAAGRPGSGGGIQSPSPPGTTATTMVNEQEVVRKAGRQAISAFLRSHNCFSVLRASGKVVVFDTRIPIQLAFYALVEHDMQAAPLWDPSQCQFVGLLKVTDFIDVLRHYRQTNTNVTSLATRSIAELFHDASIRQAIGLGNMGYHGARPSGGADEHKDGGPSMSSSPYAFWSADSSTSLEQACKLLHTRHLDFLPIVMPEDMRVLACITYTNILEHLVTHFREQRRLFDDSIYELDIGTYHDNLITVQPHQRLSEALELMHANNLSALPVVTYNPENIQDEGSSGSQAMKLVGVYSRSDITFLTKATDAEDAVANLDLPLSDILEQQRTDVTTPDALHTCSTSHTLQSIFEYFAQLRFNRLFVVDDMDRLVGVVSARDLVAYFLAESYDQI